MDNDGASIFSSPAVKHPIDPASYFTDTSEVEDLMDSSGVGEPATPQAKSTPTFGKVPRQRGDESCATNQERAKRNRRYTCWRQSSASKKNSIQNVLVEKQELKL